MTKLRFLLLFIVLNGDLIWSIGATDMGYPVDKEFAEWNLFPQTDGSVIMSAIDRSDYSDHIFKLAP
jgi:hypothetical protein